MGAQKIKPVGERFGETVKFDVRKAKIVCDSCMNLFIQSIYLPIVGRQYTVTGFEPKTYVAFEKLRYNLSITKCTELKWPL